LSRDIEKILKLQSSLESIQWEPSCSICTEGQSFTKQFHPHSEGKQWVKISNPDRYILLTPWQTEVSIKYRQEDRTTVQDRQEKICLQT